MLDIGIYRQNESLAKKEMGKWQIRSRHNLDLFEKAGFPVRVENNQQLRSLMDTMNENGFEHYLKNINGLTVEELDLFLDACVRAVEFSLEMFPSEKPILPIHNLAQAFVFYAIINKLKDYESILEIGPGSGALAYFMSQKKNLKLYAQAEACESFYILQSHLNRFLFKQYFYEGAFLKPDYKAADFWTISSSDSYQPPIELDIQQAKIKVAHYPWWRLGELASGDQGFDIIASNANLLEFSRTALFDYLALIQKKLKDDGLFVFHCEGSHANGNWDTLLPDLYNNGFAPLFLRYGPQPIGDIPSFGEVLAIAPAGNFATRFILQNKKFTSKFREIVLVDDFKVGQEMEGYRIVSREELAVLGIKDGIIYHNDINIISSFTELFLSIGMRILDVKPIEMRSFGVFVGRRHELWKKYYKLENFRNNFYCLENGFEDLLNFDSDRTTKYYTIKNITEMVLNIIGKRQSS